MSTINIGEALQRELSVLPSSYYPEVLGFIESLKMRRQPKVPTMVVPATMLLSESALSKDWDTEEEDKAWASL